MSVNNGAATTSSNAVTLSLSLTGGDAATEMSFADGNGGTPVGWSAWEPWAATKSWTLPGTYGSKTIWARARNAGGEGVAVFDAITYQLAEPTRQWTIMVYQDGDNNLEPYAINDINEMETVGSSDDVNILVQLDRIPGYDSTNGDWTGCKRFRITRDTDTSIINSPVLADLGEVNMGDPATLQDFINWGMATHPAEKYAVVFWDHGGGWRSRVLQAKQAKRPTTSDGLKAVCWDDTSGGDCLYTKEWAGAIANATSSFAMVGFDVCLAGMIEPAYELWKTGKTSSMVASPPTEPGDGWPYDTICADLVANPSMTGATLANTVVTRYGQFYSGDAMSAYDLSKMPDVLSSLNALATQMVTSNTEWSAIRQARLNSQSYEYEYYRDLRGFVENVRDTVSNSAVHSAAVTAATALGQLITSFDAGTSYAAGRGVSVSFPVDGPEAEYTNSNIAWVGDSQWDEFLTAISDATPPPAPTLHAIENADGNGYYTVAWDAVTDPSGIAGYELRESSGANSLLSDGAEGATAAWNLSGFTASTVRAHTGSKSFYSGQGNNLNRSMTLASPISLPVTGTSTLRWWVWYNTEPRWDYAYVDLSTDGGASWQTRVAYDGAGAGWTSQSLDLSAYNGRSLLLRFRYVTDSSIYYEGFYVDDIAVTNEVSTGTWAVNGSTTSVSLTGRPTGTWHYTVRAADGRENWSGLSASQSATVRDPAPILLVDDDGGDSYNTYYENALAGLGRAFDKWTVASDGPLTAEVLAAYVGPSKAVIWETGSQSASTLTANDQTVLTSFLNSAGRLFVTGQNIGYDLVGNSAGQSFYHDYLHSDYRQNATSLATTRGVAGEIIGNAWAATTLAISGGDGADNQTSADEIDPLTGAVPCFKYYAGPPGAGLSTRYASGHKQSARAPGAKGTVSSGTAGLSVDNGTYRLVYLGFGFEGISTQLDRNAVMQAVLNRLSHVGNLPPTTPTSLVVDNSAPTTDDSITATAAGSLDPEMQSVTYTYEWTNLTVPASVAGIARRAVSKVSAGYTGPTLPADQTVKGDRWQVRACASDGSDNGEWLVGAVIEIQNALPSAPATVTIALAPRPRPDRDLTATVAGVTDADGDPLTYVFEWAKSTDGGTTWGDWIAATAVVGNNAKLSAGLMTAGDKWKVRAAGNDSSGNGAWLESSVVTLDTPPTTPTMVTITPSPSASAGQALTATVVGVTDADDDPLQYLFSWAKSTDGGSTWSAWSTPVITTQTRDALPSGQIAFGEVWKARAGGNDYICGGQYRESGTVTVAYPGVVAHQPQGSAAGASWPIISTTFDQPMNKPLAQTAFSLRPDGGGAAVPGRFAWVGNEMKFSVQGALAPLTTYRATVAATAQSATGVALSEPFSWTFTTNGVPAVASWLPKSASPLNVAVRLCFNQAMNAAATQDAFSLKVAGTSTALAGSFSWSGNELCFTPSAPLAADTTYRASITTAAKSSGGVALGAPFSWDFRTNHGPSVCANLPQGPGAGASWPVIRVGFDQPMNKALTQTAFSLTPNGTSTPVPGNFVWSDNEMKYYVQGALVPLTTYRVTVAGTAQSATGVALGTPFSWTFTTNNVPAVASWQPKGAAALNAVIRLGFNQRMNTTLTQGAFSLKVAGTSTPLAGAFSWSGNELLFTPSARLVPDTTYRASITTAAQSPGGVALGAPFSWDFRTNHGPSVCANQPQGTSAGASWPVIRAAFDQPMDKALTQAAFLLAPNGTTTPVPGYFAWVDNEMKYYVQGALAPLTTYRVTVAATAQSATGVALGAPFSWTFTTNNVPAIASWQPKPSATLNPVVKLCFNQPMNSTLTEGAFSLKIAGSSTPVTGSFSWSGNELSFTPAGPLAPATTYRASVTTAAQSSGGTALGAAFSWDFRTSAAPIGVAAVAAVATGTAQGAQLLVTLGSSSDVTVTIRNLAGRPVAVLQPGLLTAGAHTLLWNGRSATGTRVPAGTYLVEVAANTAAGGTTRALVPLRLQR
ncbi:MAG: Ig-like domain-containing protein [Bacteroidota bacterium]